MYLSYYAQTKGVSREKAEPLAVGGLRLEAGGRAKDRKADDGRQRTGGRKSEGQKIRR